MGISIDQVQTVIDNLQAPSRWTCITHGVDNYDPLGCPECDKQADKLIAAHYLALLLRDAEVNADVSCAECGKPADPEIICDECARFEA